jgi:hypothetical protein
LVVSAPGTVANIKVTMLFPENDKMFWIMAPSLQASECFAEMNTCGPASASGYWLGDTECDRAWVKCVQQYHGPK